MVTPDPLPDLRSRLCSLLQEREFWLMTAGLAFLIGALSYSTEYSEYGWKFPLCTLLFVLLVAALSARLRSVAEGTRRSVCMILFFFSLIGGHLRGGLWAGLAVFSFPEGVMNFFTGGQPFQSAWGFARDILWWLFVYAFMWFLPRIDRRVLCFVFVLLMLGLGITIRSCAVTEPFYM